MAAIEGALPFSVASVVEDVLQQHGSRSRGLDLDARRAEEAGKFSRFLGEFCCAFSYFELKTNQFQTPRSLSFSGLMLGFVY